MTEFRDGNLTGARFERVSLRSAAFTQVLLQDAGMHAAEFTGRRSAASLT